MLQFTVIRLNELNKNKNERNEYKVLNVRIKKATDDGNFQWIHLKSVRKYF